MPGGGEPIDISGQFPEPTPGDESADTGTAANGDGATSVAADGEAEEVDPYAADDAELPRHVVVRIGGVTLQRLASSFAVNILGLLLVFVDRLSFMGIFLHNEGNFHHGQRRCRQRSESSCESSGRNTCFVFY